MKASRRDFIKISSLGMGGALASGALFNFTKGSILSD
jgi:anaerobic selenocysteine-containing dehydrogenase